MSGPQTSDCEAVLRQLFDYLDGELAPDRERGVSEHIEQCRSCFSRAEFERRLKAHLAELGREEVPPSLEQRVRGLIGQFGRD